MGIELLPVFGAIVAAFTLVGWVRGLYRRTLGRRRAEYRRLARLGVGARLEFVEDLMGHPAILRRRLELEAAENEAQLVFGDMQEYHEHIWSDPAYWLQVVTDGKDAVIGYTVMARTRWFRPSFTVPAGLGTLRMAWGWVVWVIGMRLVPARHQERAWVWVATRGWKRPIFRVKLNRTRFASAVPQRELREEEMNGWGRVRLRTGNRRWVYSELHTGGNPSQYLAFVLTASHISPHHAVRADLIWTMLEEEAGEGAEHFDDSTRCETPAGREFRSKSRVTAVTVMDELVNCNVWSRRLEFGPEGDEVRRLP